MIYCPNAGRPKADVFHCAKIVSRPAEVSDPNGSVRNDHDPAEKILKCLLGGKG
jgi:hypothetical protein